MIDKLHQLSFAQLLIYSLVIIELPELLLLAHLSRSLIVKVIHIPLAHWLLLKSHPALKSVPSIELIEHPVVLLLWLLLL